MASMGVTVDYYRILEISPSSTLETIKGNYKRLALDRHPDKNPENPDANAAFQLLSEAYETLKDENLRAIYDAKLIQVQEQTSQQRLSEWRAFHRTQSDKIMKGERLIKTLAAHLQYLEYEEALALEQEQERQKRSWRASIPFGSSQFTNKQKQQEEEENARKQRNIRRKSTTAELLSEQRELRRLRNELALRRQVLNMILKEDEARAKGMTLQELEMKKVLEERRVREAQQANYRAWEARRFEEQTPEMANNQGLFTRRR